MARERMVSRTIISYVMQCKYYNLLTDAMETKEVTLTGCDNLEDATKQACKLIEKTGNHRFIKIVTHETTEQLYAMKETDFLKYAKPIEKGATKVPEA